MHSACTQQEGRDFDQSTLERGKATHRHQAPSVVIHRNQPQSVAISRHPHNNQPQSASISRHQSQSVAIGRNQRPSNLPVATTCGVGSRHPHDFLCAQGSFQDSTWHARLQ